MNRPAPARPRVEELEAREVPAFGLDPTFGTGGLALDPLGGLRFRSVVAVAATAPGDKLVAAGNLVLTGPYATGGDAFAVVRLTPAGAPDPQFGGGDGVATIVSPTGYQVSATAVLSDGKILAAGSAGSMGPLPGNDWFVLRLNADGSPDPSFGAGGEMRIDFGALDLLERIEVGADGKIVLAGFTATSSPLNPTASSQLAVARLTAAGAPDVTFGTGGKVLGPLENGSWQPGGLAVQPDGKVVVSGGVSPGSDAIMHSRTAEMNVLRFTASGAPDASFGTAGRAATSYGTFTYAFANDVVVLGDGRVVVGGSNSVGNGLLAWFGPTGALQSQEQFDGRQGGLGEISDLIALPRGGVEAIGSTPGTAYALAVEYHAAPGVAADLRAVNPGADFFGTGGAALGSGGKILTAGVLLSGSDPLYLDAPLAAVRFADPGITESPRTFVQLRHFEMGDGSVSLSASAVPLFGSDELTAGTITLREGSTVLGTIDLTPVPSPFPWPSAPSPVSVVLPVGEHTVTAEYSGSGRFAASSTAVTFRVSPWSVAVRASLAVSNANPALGEDVVLTATLTPAPRGTPQDVGFVTFYDNGRVLGNVPVGAGGVAVLATDALTAGAHTLRAVYEGAGVYAPAGSTLVTVNVRASTVATETNLTASAAAAVVGAPFTLTARVRGAGAPVSGGTVTFTDGSAVLGTAVVGADGVATFTSALRVGTRTLRAAYSGAAGALASTSQSLSVTVGKALTATSLSAPTQTFTPGQVIELTASVRVTTGSAFPVGTVEFREGTRVLGTAQIDGRGHARHTVALSAGANTYTAVYLGSSTSAGSTSAAVTLSTGRATTATALTAVATPVFGQPQTLTARITGAAVGRVDFFDGQTFIGSAAVSTSGVAALTFNSNLGAHRYRAVFAGTDAADGSASGWLSQTVAKATPSVALSAGAGGAIRATVRAPYGGSPIGTVTFKAGDVVLGTAQVDGNGVATFRPAGRLVPGLYRVTAVYGGSSCFLGTTSDPFDITV